MENGNMPAMPIVDSDGRVARVHDEDERFPDGLAMGLTKREKFAMAAMQGLLSNQGIIDTFGACDEIASEAVIHADALLAELERTK